MANELIIPIKYVFDNSDIQRAGNALGALTSEEKKLESEMNALTDAVKKMTAEMVKTGQAGKRSADDTSKAQQRQLGILEALEAEYKQLKSAQAEAFRVDDIKKYGAQLDANRKKVQDLTRAADDQNKSYNILGNSLGNLTSLIAGAFAVDRILAFGKAVVEIGAEFESLRLSIDFASGSAAEGAKNFEFLQEISQRLGLDLMGAAQGFKQIVASAQQAGISNSETRRIFESVATASRAMGLSVQDSNGIFLALSQVISKGTVQAEELRGQIGERLPGAFNIAARAMGVTTRELGKMLEQGQVLSNEFLPKFATELQKTFEGALPAAVDSSRSNMARWATSWDEALDSISGRTDGFVAFMLKKGIEFNKGLAAIFGDPLYAAKQDALAKVTDFESSLTDSLKKLANKTKAGGGDVEAAINNQVAQVQAKLIADLKKAKSELKSIEENIAGRTLVPHTLKTAMVETSARVTLLTGELDVLKTLGEKVLKDAESGEAARLGTIEEIRKKMKEITAERDSQVDLTVKQATAYNLELAALQKQLDLLTKLETGNTKRSKAVKLAYLDELEGYKYLNKAKLEVLKDEGDAEKDLRDLSTRNLKDYLNEQEQLYSEFYDQVTELGMFAGNMYLNYRSNQLDGEMEKIRERYDYEINAAGDNLTARKTLEKQEEAELKKLEEKKAKLTRAAATFNILATAAEKGFAIKAQAAVLASNPLTAPLAPLALQQLFTLGAFTAAQLIAVNTLKLPGYLKGVRKVPGQYKGKDEVLAMLAPEERVITAEKNRSLTPALDILTDSKRSPQFWNKTLMEIEKLGVFSPPKIHEIAQAGSRGGIDTDRIVAAVKGIVIERTTFDERGVVRYTEKENSRLRKLNKHYGF